MLHDFAVLMACMYPTSLVADTATRIEVQMFRSRGTKSLTHRLCNVGNVADKGEEHLRLSFCSTTGF